MSDRRTPGWVPLEEKFALYVDTSLGLGPDGDCHLWAGARLEAGYGRIAVEGKMRQATHVSLELDGRPRPEAPNNYALHSCDNPSCVNPEHLSWGSNKQNMAEMVERGRSVRGLDNNCATVSDEGVEWAKDQVASGVSHRKVAKALGVSHRAVGDWVRGKCRSAA